MTGVATVAGLEFRVRLRAGRWRWLLAIWFLVLTGVAALIRASVAGETLVGDGADPVDYTGAVMFGGLMLVVLALALLIAPALSGQSVNGDRERGVLAPLQITGLSAWDITAGKLVAGWATGVVFLLMTLPLALWCIAEGGLTVGRMLGVYAVMALLMGVVCALSLGLSALVSRTSTSSVLAYLLVFFLTVGTGLLYLLLLEVTGEEVSSSAGDFSYTYTEQHPERVWWMIAPNPFVVLADASPGTPTTAVVVDGRLVDSREPADLLGAMRAEIRTYRLTPEQRDVREGDRVDGPPLWPAGLGIQLVLAAGALVLTQRRLRTPSGKLPVGQRVA